MARILTSGPGARAALSDLGLLAFRVILGLVFIAHGWQKLSENGFGGQADAFESMGIPAPAVAAAFAIVVEFGGGIALIAGVLMPLVGVLLFVDMVGAFIYVHAGTEVFVDAGGWELIAVLGFGSLLLAIVGAGRFSLDWLVAGRKRKAPVVA